MFIKILELLTKYFDFFNNKETNKKYLFIIIGFMIIEYIYTNHSQMLSITSVLTILNSVNIINILFLLFIIYFLYDKFNKKDSDNSLVISTMELSNYINKDLEKIRAMVNCQYLSISLFHNGSITFNRIHLLKMSRMYEASANNKVPRMNSLISDNINLKPYYQSMLKMVNKGYFYIENSELFDNISLKNLLMSADIGSILYVPIYNNKELIGFMCYEWDNPTMFNQDEINELINNYNQVSHYFKK